MELSEQTLRGLLAKTADIFAWDDSNRESSAGEHGDTTDDSADSEAESHDNSIPEAMQEQKFIVRFCKDMRCHTESILDLAFSLDQALEYADLATTVNRTPRTVVFTVSDPAQVYVSNILDKFPNETQNLSGAWAKRIGKGIRAFD